MSETSTPRKLATIVALDVAGYSARTEADEARTTSEVAALRPIIEGIAARHGGRIFNTAGDGFMLEFGSSIAAVEAAFQLAETCEPKVRVGVHVGDVVPQPNGDLLGHGVNVAARLMAKAEPGSTLISADVKRMMRGPIAERLQSCGVLKLDKMAETIEAFALVAVATVIAVTARTSEPVLAVLPFDNQSNDPEMVFFSDGISEEVLQIVARAHGIRVIGKGSSFQFRGDNKSVRKVATELSATHILDGSVRRSGNHIRISAHLVETSSQTTLWTDRYDRNLTDVFELHDEIAGAIAQSLKTRFVPNPRPSVEPAIYELYLRARAELTKDYLRSDAVHAVSMLEQVVASAPDFAQAWGWLSHARAEALEINREKADEPARAAVKIAAERALMLDPNCAEAYLTYVSLKQAFAGYDEKLRVVEKALSLAPNNSSVTSTHAHALAMVGRIRAASVSYERSVQLDPLLSWAHGLHARAQYSLGKTEEGFLAIEAASKRFPHALYVWHIYLQMLINARLWDKAGALLDRQTDWPQGVPQEDASDFRLCIQVAKMSPTEQVRTLRALFDVKGSAVSIFMCNCTASLGYQDLVFNALFNALDTGRTIDGGVSSRWMHARAFFVYPNSALRRDPRFATLCARLGLVDYWRSSGHWPDCADEVPYDFRAECKKAILL